MGNFLPALCQGEFVCGTKTNPSTLASRDKSLSLFPHFPHSGRHLSCFGPVVSRNLFGQQCAVRQVDKKWALPPAKAIFTEASTISGAGNCLPPVEVIFGQTEVMSLVRRKVEKSVAAGVPILIEGPNGCGKEVIARYVHAISPRRSGNFAKVNCAALPGPLMESELFGYERGAFTGAVNSKPGRLESETPGTILLDEVIDLNADLQAKLLQVLQDGKFFRLGGLEERA